MKLPTMPILAILLIIISCHTRAQNLPADDLLQWEDEISQFDSLNIIEYSDANTILVTGSSSVRLWDSIHIDLKPFQVMQRGYGGAKLVDYNYYANRIIKPQSFKAILLFIANDISGSENDRTPREVLRLFQELVAQIRERNPGTPVFWIEITPTPSRWLASEQIREANALIRKYCERNPDLFFIPTYETFIGQTGLPDSTLFQGDMLHLNRKGYELWADKILKSLHENEIQP